MNQIFALTNEKNWKSVFVQEYRLLLINKTYNTPEAFLKGYNDEGFGKLLKQKQEILIASTSSAAHPEKEADELSLFHTGGNNTLEFSRNEDLQVVIDFIQSIKKWQPTTEKVSAWSAIQSSVIGLGLTAVFGWVVYGEAKTLEDGGDILINGRRKLFKKLLAWLAEKLGTTGTFVLTGALAALCIYFIVKKLKTPPNKVAYS